MDENHNTMEYFNKMVEKGDIIECPHCGAYNAYAWEDVNINPSTGIRFINDDGFMDGGEAYTDDEILTNWPDVYNIPCAGAWEWECGKCRTHWMEKDSPLNHPCYTHSDD